VLVFAGTVPPTRVAGSGDSLVQAGGTGLAGDLPTTGQGTGAVADPLVATTPSTPDAASTTFSFEAGPFECVDAVTGRGDTPYASPGSATVVVVVT